MVDISTVSIVIAAASVVAGVVYYSFQLRHMVKTRQDVVKTRQADMLMRLYSTWGSEDLQKAATEVMNLEFKDYNDFSKKYGKQWETPTHIAVFKVGWFFNGIGVLLHSKLADIGLIDRLFGYMVIWLWKKMKPIVEGAREQFNQPKSLEWFEYLYNEMQKREQEGARNG